MCAAHPLSSLEVLAHSVFRPALQGVPAFAYLFYRKYWLQRYTDVSRATENLKVKLGIRQPRILIPLPHGNISYLS